MVNSTVLQWSRLHLSLPTKFYSSAFNDRPHSCIYHSHISLRSAVTKSTPQASTELKTVLSASYRWELSSNIQKWVMQNKKFCVFYGNFAHKNSRFCSILSQMYAVRMETSFFVVDQFKLMPVKWSFPPRFHDSTVHVLVIFLVYSIRSVHIILLDLIPVMP